MKISFILLFLIQGKFVMSDAPSEKIPQLFQLNGYDIPAEFSDESHKREVDSDIGKFNTLGEYTPKKYAELDHDSPNLNLEITRQILNRAQDNKHKEFFSITDEITNSDVFKKGQAINYRDYYNNQTGKYEKQFKNQKIADAMKQLHVNDFNKEMSNAKSRLSFIQSESKAYNKRPNYLPTDAVTQFLEVSESAKIANLVYDWEYLYSYNCWASSRWEYAFLFICWNWVWSTIYIMWIFPFSYLRPYANICIWIWFLAYPCSSSIGGRGYYWFWMSEKLTSEGIMQEVTFRQEFDVIRRVKFHSLLFMAVPDQIKIEISQDNNVWEGATDFVKSPDRSAWWWWWWISEHNYHPNTYAKSIKIILKGLRRNWYGNRHGLWWVDFYSQTQTVQIMEKHSSSAPKCVARSEVGYYQTDKPFILMNCLDAILQNDSREVFFLQQLYVRQWSDSMCVTGIKNKNSNETFITSNICRNSDEYKIVIDRLGRFMSKANPNKCFAGKDDNQITQVQQYGSVTCSGTISDSRANPYNVIDPNSSGWWAAPLELSQAIWEVNFDRQYLVEEINVQLKFIPKKMAINVLTQEGKWVTMLQEEPSDANVLLIMTPSQILGVSIHFLELDENKKSEFGKPAFGIKKVLIKRPGTPLSYQTCSYQGKESKLVNRFKIENVEYIETSYLIPHRAAKHYLYDVYQNTKKVIEIFIIQANKIKDLVQRAQEIQKQIKSVNQQIDAIYKQLGPYKNLVKQEGQAAKGKCYACSPETSALNCHLIKKKSPKRTNGFFWIKSKCMPQAERVYCDFEAGQGNFYYYEGNFRDKSATIDANSIEKAQEVCKKIGLESVEIKTKEQTTNVIDYLNLVGANSEDEYGIPLGYSFDKKFLGEKFQSMNGKQSQDITKVLGSFMEQQNMMDKLTTIGADTMVLMKSKTKIFKTYLSTTKVRGVVCSENKSQEQISNGQVKATCDSNIHTYGATKINTILKVECPDSCGKAKEYKIFGSAGQYSDLSSICRAAIHAGSIKDQEGGVLEVRVIQGKEKYSSQTANDIESFEASGSTSGFGFSAIQKPIEQACPNLKPHKNKKSFYSFSDIIDKVKSKKQASFIESRENLNNKLAVTLSDQLKVFEPSDDPTSGNGEQQMTQKEAMGYVNKQLTAKQQFLDKYKQFIKDSAELMKQYELLLLSVYGSSLNPQTQSTVLTTTLLRIQATKQMIQDLVQKGQAKLAKYLEKYVQKVDDLFFLQRYEPQNEKYNLSWESQYIISDSTNTKNGPGRWKFTKEDVYPHKEAIAQLSDITCGQSFEQPSGECTATVQNLKYKRFYDFKLELDFKVRKQGFIGIIFRQLDQYNYYSLDMKNDQMQFRIMKDGEQRIISSAKIEKILSDTWYNIQLVAEQIVFVAKIGKETDPSNPNKYQVLKEVLRGEDAQFKNGYQSLMSDGTLGFFVDGYRINPIDCWKDTFDEKKVVHHRQPFSSRFIELYLSDISQIWEQNKKENIKWTYMMNAFGRKKALSKKLSREETSISPIVLIEKQLYNGWVSFDLFIETKSTEFSFVFFYENDRNYSELQILKDSTQIIDITDGERSVTMNQPRNDIYQKTWYTIYVQIHSNIEIYFEAADAKNKVRQSMFLKTIEKPVQKGPFIGFNVNKGSVGIDKIRLQPGKIPTPEDTNPALNQKDHTIGEKIYTKKQPQQHQQQHQSKGQQKFNFDVQICLNTTLPKQEKWCENETGGIKAVKMNCQANFCEQCCHKNVPPNKTNQIQSCVKECQPVKPDQDSAYKQCFDSMDPSHTVLSICNAQFPEMIQHEQLTQCKVDFCDMCCILTPLMINQGMLKKDLDDCYKQCHTRFDNI